MKVMALKNGWKTFPFKDYKSYDFFKEAGIIENAEDFFRKYSDDLFLRAKPMPYAQYINMIPKEHNVSIITSQFKGLEGLTLEWLENNGIAYDDIHFTWDKSSVKLDVLVDDFPGNFEYLDKKTMPVCYRHLYNKQFKGYTVKNMKDFVENMMPKLALGYCLEKRFTDYKPTSLSEVNK